MGMRGWSLLVTILYAVVGNAQQLPHSIVLDSRTGQAVPFNSVVTPGRVTMITFWGTWCAHGKHQVKTIAAKLPEWRKQADFDFVAIAEDQVGTENLVTKFVTANKWSFPCYTDAAAVLKASLRFFALPYTMVIDRKGMVVYAHIGYSTGEDFVGAMLAVR